MSPERLSISIIVCTFERTADLLATLGSIRQVRIPEGLTAELIVVDSSRDEDTRQALHALDAIPGLPLRVLHEPRRGKAHALNTGVAAARGEVLLFTDDDLRVPVDWIEGMARPILTGKAEAVAGGIHLAPELVQPWMGKLHRCWMASTEILDPLHPESFFGANMAFTRRVLEKVPLFDPELGTGTDLGGCDESLFAFQVREAGYRIVSAFETSAEHHFDARRLARKYFLQRARVEGRSAAYILHHWRHETLPHPYFTLLFTCLKWLIKGPYYRWKWAAPDGASERELQHLIVIHYVLQYLRERRRPHKYDKRGLIKRGASVPSPVM